MSASDLLDVARAEHLVDSGDTFDQGTPWFFVLGRGGLSRVTVLRRTSCSQIR
jgi:hypothetical protein